MSIGVDHPPGSRSSTVIADPDPVLEDVIVARDLTAEEMDWVVARFEAAASAERRQTWHRRRNIRTPVSRPSQHKPKGRRP